MNRSPNHSTGHLGCNSPAEDSARRRIRRALDRTPTAEIERFREEAHHESRFTDEVALSRELDARWSFVVRACTPAGRAGGSAA